MERETGVQTGRDRTTSGETGMERERGREGEREDRAPCRNKVTPQWDHTQMCQGLHSRYIATYGNSLGFVTLSD